MRRRSPRACCLVAILASGAIAGGTAGLDQQRPAQPAPPRAQGGALRQAHGGAIFRTADNCLACHNGLETASGEDVSIGAAWRGSMMANSSRDPYWQAAVRREVMDHPRAAADIEDECAVCHMPMAHTEAKARGSAGRIFFAHLQATPSRTEEGRLAMDGVSCTMCHQIRPDGLGTPASFTGRFVVDASAPFERRAVFGPFQVDAGRTAVMRSATGYVPTEGTHLRQSAMCATCHTLYVKARDSASNVIGEFPEQVPFLEWRHSAYVEQQSCQSCHMPPVTGLAPMASVLGEPRAGLAKHVFRGGNFFVLEMLNRYRDELGVEALPEELHSARQSTLDLLRSATATVVVQGVERSATRLDLDVIVRNLAGHKLPTGYPSRRVWLHLIVRDGGGRTVFESGRLTADGSIEGNDNDRDPLRYEPHHAEIRDAGSVQIYESIMADADGAVTTGLVSGVRYLKDNRLLPSGFDKATAHDDIAVRGTAASDESFTAGGDTIRYSVDVSGSSGPFTIDASLRFQPIAYRWARNLAGYSATETTRFVSYFDAMAARSSELLAQTTATSR